MFLLEMANKAFSFKNLSLFLSNSAFTLDHTTYILGWSEMEIRKN
jgi:hypothetical protein